jgi:quercetin dioxygenase-like cupin family protein
MTTAPVDITATFDGAMWHSTAVEPAFQWRGRRIRPGFTVPRRHHNFRQLTIVVGGSADVEYDGEARRVGPSEFWVAEAGVPCTVTAGPQGVTYLECWNGALALAETYWHDDEHWKRR